jgi:hypothetical protein
LLSLIVLGGSPYGFRCEEELLNKEFFRQPIERLLGGRGRRLGLRTIHEVLQFFAGFEEGNFFRRNLYLGAGFRIAANSPSAFPRAEAAESADFDFLPLL